MPDASEPSEGGARGSDVEGAESVAFCAAFSVVQAKCQRCHGEPLRNGAPVPFMRYEDFLAPYGGGEQTYADVAARAVELDIMPYVALNEPPRPVMPPVEPLTAEEKATLLGWLEQGAQPVGGTDCP